jgi:hypothetical protein
MMALALTGGSNPKSVPEELKVLEDAVNGLNGVTRDSELYVHLDPKGTVAASAWRRLNLMSHDRTACAMLLLLLLLTRSRDCCHQLWIHLGALASRREVHRP